LVAGLGMYGAEIIKQIGMRLSKITPSRGLCIELGAAIVVIMGRGFHSSSSQLSLCRFWSLNQ